MVHQLPQLDTHHAFQLLIEDHAFIPVGIDEKIFLEPSLHTEDVCYIVRYKVKDETRYKTDDAKGRLVILIELHGFKTESPY